MTAPATATHRAINLSGVNWVERGHRAGFQASRPGYGVQVIATGEVLSSDGVTPSVWRSKAAAQMIAEYPRLGRQCRSRVDPTTF
jgi:hypothetical protein